MLKSLYLQINAESRSAFIKGEEETNWVGCVMKSIESLTLQISFTQVIGANYDIGHKFNRRGKIFNVIISIGYCSYIKFNVFNDRKTGIEKISKIIHQRSFVDTFYTVRYPLSMNFGRLNS